jgi:hypothetical protein
MRSAKIGTAFIYGKDKRVAKLRLIEGDPWIESSDIPSLDRFHGLSRFER